MLRVPIASAKPGMVLAMPVLHPRRADTVLLNAGVVLDEYAIGRLEDLRLSAVWIRYPGMDFIEQYVCPRVFESQAALTEQIGEAFEAVSHSAQPRLHYNDYRTAIAELLDRLLIRPKAAIFVQEIADRDRPALRHSSTVCLLSVLMGLKLDEYLISERSRLTPTTARDVASLGVGAMMHDIGMLRLPAEVVARWNKTQDESDADWRQHVLLGFETVKDAIGPAAAAAVLHHHQKFDGSGFPRRRLLDGRLAPMKGREIHIFARILAAADLFDRVRFPPGRGEEAPVPTVRALNRLRQPPHCHWLDPVVYKALLAVAPAYPPGTLVTLSNGVKGVVIEWFPEDPCRPVVEAVGQVERDFADDSRPRERYCLRDDPDLAIVQADGEDVRADNFYPTTPGEFDLSLATGGRIARVA